ncbi:MAG: 3'-5' exonuclease [Saprospiraceae bacterium]|nr:3'-5' exonuclease [Saprospiraceae bacterium]
MHFIIFDLEATCWTEESPLLEQEIIEIGAFYVDPYAQIQDRFHSMVRPVIHPYLSPFCRQLTTIAQEEVDDAPTFDRAFKQWEDWAEELDKPDLVYCSWGSGDLDLLEHDCHYHDLDWSWKNRHFDVKKAYNRKKRRSGKPYGLRTALKKEDIELEGQHHRALDDAYNLAKLFCRYIDEWDY